jgi:hypothetical protein
MRCLQYESYKDSVCCRLAVRGEHRSLFCSSLGQPALPGTVKHYLLLHPKARLSPEEQQLIYDWAKAERKHIKQQIEGQRDKPPAN